MRKLPLSALWLVLLIGITAVAGVIGKRFGDEAFVATVGRNSKPSDAAVVAALKQAAETVTKTLPKRIDNLTTLISIQADKQPLMYKYQVNASLHEIDITGFSRQQQRNLNLSVCHQENMRHLIRDGVTYHYKYIDNSGEDIAKLAVDDAICKSNGL
jgi:hypothetical protein